MTAHNHTTIVEGCYRCSLGMDEEVGMTNVTPREHEAFRRGVDVGEDRSHDDVVDLHERLERAVTTLGKMKHQTERVSGKIEGVKLALSYVRETWRDI